LDAVGHWQVDPVAFLIFLRFSIFQTLKLKTMIFPMCKIHQIVYRDSWKDKEQLSFLAQLQIPSGFQVTISGTNSNLNLS
jgi:hypothetical protein